LLTLRDFKAGRNTALHFLCASLVRDNPSRDAADILTKELVAVVKAAATVQIQTLQAQVRAFCRDFEVTSAECRSFLHEYDAKVTRRESDPLKSLDPSPEKSALKSDMLDDDGEEETPCDLEVYEAEADAAGVDDEDASHRFVEDVQKIRGSARVRLKAMWKVMDKLKGLLMADYNKSVLQSQETLRFCGLGTRTSKDLSVDLEALLQQIADFLKIFRQIWDEVQKDLPQYQMFFADCTGGEAESAGQAAGGSSNKNAVITV
jgi:hypothetical protein